MSAPVRRAAATTASRGRRRELAYRETVAASAEVLRRVTAGGSRVLVISRGDDKLLALGGRTGWHFPRLPDGRWAGYHPADSEAAIAHLEELRSLGADYLALPSSSFWWLHHYEGLAEHLEERYRRIHSDEHVIVFDVGDEPRARGGAVPGPPRAGAGRRAGRGETDPPADLVESLAAASGYDVAARRRGARPTGSFGSGRARSCPTDSSTTSSAPPRSCSRAGDRALPAGPRLGPRRRGAGERAPARRLRARDPGADAAPVAGDAPRRRATTARWR